MPTKFLCEGKRLYDALESLGSIVRKNKNAYVTAVTGSGNSTVGQLRAFQGDDDGKVTAILDDIEVDVPGKFGINIDLLSGMCKGRGALRFEVGNTLSLTAAKGKYKATNVVLAPDWPDSITMIPDDLGSPIEVPTPPEEGMAIGLLQGLNAVALPAPSGAELPIFVRQDGKKKVLIVACTIGICVAVYRTQEGAGSEDIEMTLPARYVQPLGSLFKTEGFKIGVNRSVVAAWSRRLRVNLPLLQATAEQNLDDIMNMLKVVRNPKYSLAIEKDAFTVALGNVSSLYEKGAPLHLRFNAGKHPTLSISYTSNFGKASDEVNLADGSNISDFKVAVDALQIEHLMSQMTSGLIEIGLCNNNGLMHLRQRQKDDKVIRDYIFTTLQPEKSN